MWVNYTAEYNRKDDGFVAKYHSGLCMEATADHGKVFKEAEKDAKEELSDFVSQFFDGKGDWEFVSVVVTHASDPWDDIRNERYSWD